MAKLTEKQKRFCEEYMIDLNGTQAAIRAGYSKKTANEQAARLLANVSINNYISELRAKQEERTGVSADEVIHELYALGFWNIQDFVKPGNLIVDLTTLDRSVARPVVGIKIKERYDEQGNKEVTTELKLVDKRAALVDLGRHLGIFEKDNKQKNAVIKVGYVNDDDE